jgi:hypothetical protein
MPGLGLGLGLNKRQQNRFAQAAQTPGGGAGWLAQHPNIQQRVNRVDPTSQQATNIGNFVGAGQIAPNAAQRFQPPGAQAPAAGGQQPPQGTGATGSNKPSGGGGQGPQRGTQGLQGEMQGLLTSQGGPAAGQQQPQQGGYNPPWGTPGSPQWNNYLQQQDQQQKAWMAAHPGMGNPFAGQTQGPASLGYQPGYVWQGSGYGPPGGAAAGGGQAGMAQQQLQQQLAGGQGRPQQMNPQTMQALLQALMGQQR